MNVLWRFLIGAWLPALAAAQPTPEYSIEAILIANSPGDSLA